METKPEMDPKLQATTEGLGGEVHPLPEVPAAQAPAQVEEKTAYRWGMPDFTDPATLDLLVKQIAPNHTPAELQLFIMQCNRTQLDPFCRQIYSLKRSQYDSLAKAYVMKQSIQTSIDGFRLIADRTRKYAGQVGPWWCGPDGVWVEVWLSSLPPAAARVGVLRHDFEEPMYAVALYGAYLQTNKEGVPIGRWKTDPAGMLAKCAEALALRRAFPQELSGLYTGDEMGQADNPTTAPQLPEGAGNGNGNGNGNGHKAPAQTQPEKAPEGQKAEAGTQPAAGTTAGTTPKPAAEQTRAQAARAARSAAQPTQTPAGNAVVDKYAAIYVAGSPLAEFAHTVKQAMTLEEARSVKSYNQTLLADLIPGDLAKLAAKLNTRLSENTLTAREAVLLAAVEKIIDKQVEG